MTADSILLEEPLFQFFTILNSISDIGEIVWGEYEQYSIPKIETATKELTDHAHILPQLSREEAAHQLSLTQKIIKPFSELRKKMEKEERADHLQFKNAVLDFFIQLDHIEKQLAKAADQADNVRAVFHHMTHNRKNPAISKYLK